MKDKEKLLSFKSKLKFIFSHSALREGWDSPNVFQICALREMGTERERRQTIGRGLRLCVNQQGERLHGYDVNTLTVIATESYEQFAENLQKEIETDTGIRFGIVEKHQFASIPVTDAAGRTTALGVKQSEAIWNHLKEIGLVDGKGMVQDSLRQVLKNNTFTLPEAFAAPLPQVKEILRKLAGKLEIKNADERKQVKTGQAILQSEEFKGLWDRIKHKTTYRVMFDNEGLIRSCVKAIDDASPITKTRLQWRKADLAIGKAGVEAKETAVSAPIVIDEPDLELPDVLTDLQDKTQLTRRSLVRILTESERLNDFKKNPQEFIDLVAEAINRVKRLAIVDGIKYQRIGDEEAVKVYAKLPGWFQIPTPLGGYNPDWALLVDKDGTERLYFVVETKSSLFTDDLRDREAAKIKCGEEHFKALAVGENSARFVKATNLDDVLTR